MPESFDLIPQGIDSRANFVNSITRALDKFSRKDAGIPDGVRCRGRQRGASPKRSSFQIVSGGTQIPTGTMRVVLLPGERRFHLFVVG